MKHTPSRRVLIAVEPPAFVRLIEHVLHGQAGLRVIGRSRAADAEKRSRRLAPDVIIANTRSGPVQPGSVSAQRLADLKREHPASRLVLLTHDLDDTTDSSRGAAHARLREEAVVRRLVPVIRRLLATAS